MIVQIHSKNNYPALLTLLYHQVADFGLARWHSKWSSSIEEQVIGTSGYLTPHPVICKDITCEDSILA